MLKICLAVMLVTCVASFIRPQLSDYYEDQEDIYRRPQPPANFLRKRSDQELRILCGKRLTNHYKKQCQGNIRLQQEYGPSEEYEKFITRCCQKGCSNDEVKKFVCSV